ncbi:MAG: phosphate ABC transporter permease subunit PstC [Candidatus Omnitrophota bacterium]
MQQTRLLNDKIAEKCMWGLALFVVLIVFFMAFGLYQKSRPLLAMKSLNELLFSSSWYPLKGKFGFFPFLIGTFWVTIIAGIIAVPPCLLSAIYLSEYAPPKIRGYCASLIDLLAGIPSVIYGVWGVLVLVPLIKNHLAPAAGVFSTGYCALAGGLVLAVMISPVIIHVSSEVFSSVSHELRDASLSLGATSWQTVKYVVLRKAAPGVLAAIVLGLSRAFGETMAVLMVAGNVAKIPSSVFDPVYPLPALIANHYGEMLSVPLYDSALLFASFILLLVVLLFNSFSRLILLKLSRDAE